MVLAMFAHTEIGNEIKVGAKAKPIAHVHHKHAAADGKQTAGHGIGQPHIEHIGNGGCRHHGPQHFAPSEATNGCVTNDSTQQQAYNAHRSIDQSKLLWCQT